MRLEERPAAEPAHTERFCSGKWVTGSATCPAMSFTESNQLIQISSLPGLRRCRTRPPSTMFSVEPLAPPSSRPPSPRCSRPGLSRASDRSTHWYGSGVTTAEMFEARGFARGRLAAYREVLLQQMDIRISGWVPCLLTSSSGSNPQISSSSVSGLTRFCPRTASTKSSPNRSAAHMASQRVTDAGSSLLRGPVR